MGGSRSSPAAVQEWVGQFSGREVHVAMRGVHGLAVRRSGGRARAGGVRTWPRRSRPGRCGVASVAAKTDRQDALWLRELLAEGRLPEAWIAAEHVRQWRSRLHLRKALIDERTQWLLRIRSVLYHHGLSAGAPGEIAGADGRGFSLAWASPPTPASGSRSRLAWSTRSSARSTRSNACLRRVARHQTGCQALMTQFGVGELIALTFLTELGDATRMSSSRKAVRFAGLDIGVHRSDQTSPRGQAHPPRLIALALGAL